MSSPSQPRPAHAPAARAADVAWLTLGGAAVATLVHAGQVEFRLRVLGVFTWTHREFAWLSLAGYLACFAALAIPVALLVAARRGRAGLGLVSACFTSLVAFAILLFLPRLHPAAQLALAIGIGTQVGRWISSNPPAARRWIRRVAVGATSAVVVLGLAASARFRFGEGGRVRALPAAPTEAPNIVLLIMDTVRAASMSLYGYERETTPMLTALARESTVFDRAFATAPWTAPSHASMMTGLWPSQAGADYLHPMYDSLPTLAQALGRRGYVSGGFMSNTGYAGYQLGISRGFTHYEDFAFTLEQALWSTTLTQTWSGQQIVEGLLSREPWRIRQAVTHPNLRTATIPRADHRTAADIAANFFAWRDQVGNRPYFAMLNFMDAHAPYNPPNGFRTRFNGGREEMDRYDGGIAYEDSVIGTIVQRLRERGELDRTVLIVTSDHGEQWNEHGLGSHGNSLYLPLLHVPLLVRAPGRVPANARIARVVSLRDLAATISGFAGESSGTLPGTSLSITWGADSGASVSPVIAEAAAAVNPSKVNLTRFGPIRSAIDAEWHSIHYGNGRAELFAWRRDPGELDDRSNAPEASSVLAGHRALIGQQLRTGWPVPRHRLH
jgi:arylsulfatase A-like enzyme